jgi:hypothetical protein
MDRGEEMAAGTVRYCAAFAGLDRAGDEVVVLVFPSVDGVDGLITSFQLLQQARSPGSFHDHEDEHAVSRRQHRRRLG